MNTHSHSSCFRHFAILAALLGLLAFTGCRTMEGAGKDIERAGEKIQDNAR